MDVIEIIILGLVEGITEFLPVSSTGHMIVVSNWLTIDQSEAHKAFEVIIQLAAILSVIAYYKNKFSLKYVDLWKKVLLAFMPIGVIGFLFHQQIKMLFTVPVVGTMFIIGGFIFLIVEHYYQNYPGQIKEVNKITYKQAFLIGIAQVFALIPGTSRAGASIIGGLLVGLNRKSSAEFSFLLALPVLAAAAGFDLLKHYNDLSNSDWAVLFCGFITSFLVAYLTIKLFIKFLQKFTFIGFGIYRIAFGTILLWIL